MRCGCGHRDLEDDGSCQELWAVDSGWMRDLENPQSTDNETVELISTRISSTCWLVVYR